MKAAVETSHGALSDAEVPSKSLLGQKLEQVEDNSPQAEDLRDVTSVEDAATEAYFAVIDPASHQARQDDDHSSLQPRGASHAASPHWLGLGDGAEQAWEAVMAARAMH